MTCDQLGTCCGCCEGYTCGDCYFCRQAGCDPQGMNGACPGSPAEPCCYCAPRCLLVIIGGIVVNSDRNCFDCCENPTTHMPCASGDDCCPPCDPHAGVVYNPDCVPLASYICSKQCPNNDSCGHFNGTYIIKMDEWSTCECGSGGWSLNPSITEPPKYSSPCCEEANETWEFAMLNYCVEGACPPPGPTPCADYGTCCPAPCWPSGYDGYGNAKPCPTPYELRDCPGEAAASGEVYSACGAKQADPSIDCNGPWSMVIYSCMNYLNSDWPLYLSGFEWVAQVAMSGLGGGFIDFKRTWWEGTDWPMGENAFGGWINCAGVGALPRFTPANPRTACDWSQSALSVVPIGCPVVFWQKPQQLYFMKNDEKYINLSEVKRRKLVKKTQDRIKKTKIADINIQQENFSFQEDFFQIVQDNVLQVMIQNDPEKFEAAKLQADLNMENQIKELVFRSRHRPANIRNSEEILDIYENTCKNCPYFSQPSSVCMLNDKTIKKTISLNNMLTDADAECPDFPPRWGKTTNLEPEPKRPEVLKPPQQPQSHPKIL